MKISITRSLIFFSVALNIGFLIMSVYQFYQHAQPFSERRWNELMTMVEHLDLPEERYGALSHAMAEMKTRLDRLEDQIDAGRVKTHEMLSRPEPVDLDALHRQLVDGGKLYQKKCEFLEAHVIELGRILTDSERAAFFGAMTEKIRLHHKR